MKPRLLGMGGLASMIPGSVDAEMAVVDVPVFLALGEHDIAGDPHIIPACFWRDSEIVVVAGAGEHEQREVRAGPRCPVESVRQVDALR